MNTRYSCVNDTIVNAFRGWMVFARFLILLFLVDIEFSFLTTALRVCTTKNAVYVYLAHNQKPLCCALTQTRCAITRRAITN